ncbi:MAG TPA: hypothetical protein VKC66_36165, partial [Xanthobacteraceae bacterium]|nr:hypothetical protein [Xanthobacteraceae bacterium]
RNKRSALRLLGRNASDGRHGRLGVCACDEAAQYVTLAARNRRAVRIALRRNALRLLRPTLTG